MPGLQHDSRLRFNSKFTREYTRADCSWWTLPMTRAQFMQRAHSEFLRMSGTFEASRINGAQLDSTWIDYSDRKRA